MSGPNSFSHHGIILSQLSSNLKYVSSKFARHARSSLHSINKLIKMQVKQRRFEYSKAMPQPLPTPTMVLASESEQIQHMHIITPRTMASVPLVSLPGIRGLYLRNPFSKLCEHDVRDNQHSNVQTGVLPQSSWIHWLCQENHRFQTPGTWSRSSKSGRSCLNRDGRSTRPRWWSPFRLLTHCHRIFDLDPLLNSSPEMMGFTIFFNPSARVWNLRFLLTWTVLNIVSVSPAGGAFRDGLKIKLGIIAYSLILLHHIFLSFQWSLNGLAFVDLLWVLVEMGETASIAYILAYILWVSTDFPRWFSRVISGVTSFPLLASLTLSALFRIATMRQSQEQFLRQRFSFLGGCKQALSQGRVKIHHLHENTYSQCYWAWGPGICNLRDLLQAIVISDLHQINQYVQ
ncbi:hypothetical protein B0H19DRAFT_569209 [Mycena capillaripes]|nr:hypothetical protein B0H19DRAFT_569209 [Mycena capillaripes]